MTIIALKTKASCHSCMREEIRITESNCKMLRISAACFTVGLEHLRVIGKDFFYKNSCRNICMSLILRQCVLISYGL